MLASGESFGLATQGGRGSKGAVAPPDFAFLYNIVYVAPLDFLDS